MAESVDILIETIHARIDTLLNADVIEHTIVVMRELGHGLRQLVIMLDVSGKDLTVEHRKKLTETLLPLTSESIREALHKGELGITNGIIASKNRLLTIMGIEIPESHREIDVQNYVNYTW
ncbi:MAG: hypothetical protein EBV06_08920 [Planctomycetia bacterium]|nr:hypothetical protein [Planctomycetia bacterium]